MKQTLLSSFFFLMAIAVFGQCPTAPLTISAQVQADNFKTNYPGCTELPFGLSIKYYVISLDSLSELKSVKGYLNIESCTALKTLHGLSKLELIDGDLNIVGNSLLEDVSGLSELKKIKGDFVLNENEALLTLDGLSKLTDLDKNASITDNPNLTQINGLDHLEYVGESFTVTGNLALDNFDGLDALLFVNSNLSISHNDGLKTLNGLKNLEYVGGWLEILGNTDLEEITGLGKLEAIDKDLTMLYNISLPGFPGFPEVATLGGNLNTDCLGGNSEAFPKLATIGGRLNIFLCDNLTELKGFGQLTAIFNNLNIQDNLSMKSIDAFEKLGYVGGSLNIHHNGSLMTVAGFDSLKTINQSFLIYMNGLLSGITGFGNLQKIGKSFTFAYCDHPTSLGFLKNLETVNWRINIYHNTSLADCNAYYLCDKLATSFDSVSIWGNATGCNNQNDLASTCTGIYAFAKGHVFVDFACDSLENGQDVVFPNKILRYTDDYPFATTNFWGDYVKLVKPGINYTFKSPETLGFLPQPTSRSVKSQIYTDSFPHEDFRLCPDGEVTNLCVSIAPSNNPRPGFTTHFNICVANLGNTFVPGTLILDIADSYSKDRIDTMYYSVAPAGVTGPAVIWNIDTLPPFQTTCIEVWIKWKTTLPIGVFVTTQVNISPNGTSDADNSNNIIALRQTSVGSFDPNDKAVNLPAIGLQIAQNRGSLDYQIRFQNTGNFPATFVHVVDTISPLLDTRTIEMLDASHPYILEFPTANVLKWRFEDINLPDSTSDELGSHGYVLFRIKTAPVNFQKDSVFNRCGIYFDYNAPVITNFAKTVITKEIVATQSPENGLFLQAAPNPADAVCSINFSLETAAFCEMKLTDLAGRPVQIFSKRKLEAGGQTVPVDLRGLPGGVYFFEIKTGTKQGTIKIVKL